MESIPVTLLTGFLGAGKTTFLRHILSGSPDLSDTLVIVNEFGKIGIDGEVLRHQNLRVVELVNGCICCTLTPDLTAALDEVFRRFSPRRILIEASGVGDPAGIISVVRDARYRGRLTLSHTLTVLSTDDWDAREVFGRLFFHQLEAAQVILLNKIDLFPPDDISRMFQEIQAAFPNAIVIPARHCRIDPGIFGSAATISAPGPQPERRFTESGVVVTSGGHPIGGHLSILTEPAPAMGFTAFDFQTPERMDAACFYDFLRRLPGSVLRIKGPMQLDEATVLFNYAGGRTEWQQWRGENYTRLVFVGLNVDADEILLSLQACVCGSDS
jgi:G3E family GTPase